MRRNASMVALSTLCGLFVPSVLVRTSCTPAASRTGRTAPPAITPVPWAAGRRYTRAAPKRPVISHGIVVSRSGTRTRSFLACSTDFRMASGTSRALPSPTPTCPRPSPTTTSAVKEKRRPPLTTLATRLIATTRSVRSSALASIRASANPASSPLSEHQAGRARGLGQGLHPSVILIAATIEHDPADPARLGAGRQQLADDLGRRHVAAGVRPLAKIRGAAVHGDERAPRRVVDDLGIDVVQAAEHRQPRPLGRPPDQLPHADVSDAPTGDPVVR